MRSLAVSDYRSETKGSVQVHQLVLCREKPDRKKNLYSELLKIGPLLHQFHVHITEACLEHSRTLAVNYFCKKAPYIFDIRLGFKYTSAYNQLA